MNLKRRVERLEAVVFPPKIIRIPTEKDIRWSQCFEELLVRIDPVIAQAIREEARVLTEASEFGYEAPPMSNLFLGYAVTILEHLRINSALEFPAIVAQVYLDAPDTNGGSVGCSGCSYPLPKRYARGQLDQCPICLTPSGYRVKAQ